MTTKGLYIEEVDADGVIIRTPGNMDVTPAQIETAVGVGGSWILDLGLCALLGVGPVQA